MIQIRPRPGFLVLLLAVCLAAGCGDWHEADRVEGQLEGTYVGQEIWISYGPAKRDEQDVVRTGRPKEEAQRLAERLRGEVSKGADIGKLAMQHSNAPGGAGLGYTGRLPVDPAHPTARERALASVPIGGLTPVFEWREGFGFARRLDLAQGEALKQHVMQLLRQRARFRSIALLYQGAWIPDAFAKDKVKRTREQAVARADAMLRELKAGASFEELARLHSEDADSARRGGIVAVRSPDGSTTEWISRQDPHVPASVLEAVFSTPVGQLYPEVIVSKRGVFLVKVEGRKAVDQ